MTPTPDPPLAAPLTAEEIAAIEELHNDSDRRDRWSSTPRLIADLRDAHAEVAALRDRLARAEARIGTALHLTCSLDALDREDSHLPMNDRVLLNRILVHLGHYDAPTDGAARDGER